MARNFTEALKRQLLAKLRGDKPVSIFGAKKDKESSDLASDIVRFLSDRGFSVVAQRPQPHMFADVKPHSISIVEGFRGTERWVIVGKLDEGGSLDDEISLRAVH